MTPPWIDLTPERLRFRITGADRVRYLNGQVTHDVRKTSPAKALPACLCHAKGRIEAEVFVTRDSADESLLVDGPAELGDFLHARLEKYLVSDDCEIVDITAESRLWHVAWPLSTSQPPEAFRESLRLGVPGLDVWQIGGAPAIEPGPPLDEATRERLRIRHGVPRWGRELLAGEVFPAEAGLDKWAVDFHKGCYVGQEVVSRIQSAGKVNRRLCLLAGDGASAIPSPGDAVRLSATGPDLARLTSVVPDDGENAGWLGLAFLPRDHTAPETGLVIVPDGDRLHFNAEIRTFLPVGVPG